MTAFFMAAADTAARVRGGNLRLEVASGDALHVRQFAVQERISSLFQLGLVAVSESPSIDFDAVLGQQAHFTLHAGRHERRWSGLCNHLELLRAEPDGLSTYEISLVPSLWLLTQRKNYRIFQQMTEPDIVLQVLAEWGITPEVHLDRPAYKKRKYRVQYAESDFAFISRMLEDAGIAYYFQDAGAGTTLVLSDRPHGNPVREEPLPFLDSPTAVDRGMREHVTAVRVGQRVRPGRYTLRDHDYRRPAGYNLAASAASGSGVEQRLERYQYTPGAFLFGTDRGEGTPTADDRGKTRTDENEAAALAQRRLDAKRGNARVCTFETNAHDLAPGMVLRLANHPRADLAESRPLLVVESRLSGTHDGEWTHHCEARGTDVAFRPPLVTPKPKVSGVESATVVGPPGEEIHTDEFGRVRVHFHWDRESKMNADSSCWIHVSQAWAGGGFGGVNLPRVGQEVIVDFLGGDPDRPIIVGRLYTGVQRVPYRLPENRTQSGWRSCSTNNTGGYNEIMFEDAAGSEVFHTHAERDHIMVVKRDCITSIGRDATAVIGRDRIASVHRDDIGVVHRDQMQHVGRDQTLNVRRSKMQVVKENLIQQTVEGYTYQKSKGVTYIESDEAIILKVGDKSTVIIGPDGIIIQAPRVDINPQEGA